MAAVLFDFSGTLFRVESTESWLSAVLREAGLALPGPELSRAAAALEAESAKQKAKAAPANTAGTTPPTAAAT